MLALTNATRSRICGRARRLQRKRTPRLHVSEKYYCEMQLTIAAPFVNYFDTFAVSCLH